VQLTGDAPYAHAKLVWSKDSQRVASFRDDHHAGATRIFFRNGSRFDEIKMPELAPPQLPQLPKTDASNNETMRRVEPIRWTESGDLFLEDEMLNKAGARAANEITIGFDDNHRAAVRKSEPEKMSISDYFCLLPPNTLENPAYEWMQVMRANGNIIDKKSGYMSCPGDGAQPEYEVALFRYRDGRPLLAYCSGELEGDDSAYLQFFELGPDNKMHSVTHSMLPGAEREYDPELGEGKGNWRFVLPRESKTILVRMKKSGKVKFTWDGERFQKEK
jgi:hypothetical protein